MPWFPDFVAAAELARRKIRAAGQADPVAAYLREAIGPDAVHRGTSELRTYFSRCLPVEVRVYDDGGPPVDVMSSRADE